MITPLLPVNGRPALLLAPMQDVTDLPFLRTVAKFGGADLYVTEYFRVHIHSRPDPWILRSITENPTGRSILAQLIGNDPAEMVRSAIELQQYPIAGIDLNLGCPAPVVYRKNAGGGLLRNLDQLDELLGRLREACRDVKFTVKTRLGFESPTEFESLLEIFSRHHLDMLTIHGRTVRERYQSPVHPDQIKRAVEGLGCPVVANGNVVDHQTGEAYLEQTGAAGLMVGRGAIRNPWIFDQLRDCWSNRQVKEVTGKMMLEYIETLYDETAREIPCFVEEKHVQKMKKYLVYITQGFDPGFEYEIRRSRSRVHFFEVCKKFLKDLPQVPGLPSENSKLFCGFSQFL